MGKLLISVKQKDIKREEDIEIKQIDIRSKMDGHALNKKKDLVQTGEKYEGNVKGANVKDANIKDVVDEKFETPYFKAVTGLFIDKKNADKELQKILRKFKSAFVFKEEITLREFKRLSTY